ncbi:MAG: Na-translocating system protein MpsC family protein [Solirubrobacterales bacterium]
MNEQDTGPVREDDAATHSVRAELSREMVRLYKDLFGRGPTMARTDFAGPDILICTLEDSFTPAERALVAMGEHQRLRDTRQYFQYATEDRFCGVVERVLDRKVRAFVSGVDTKKDVSSELFYLDGPSGSSSNGL